MPIFECRFSNADFRMPIFECRLSNADCRMPIFECRLSNADCRMPIVECRLSNADFRMPIFECRLSNADCRMPIVECRLSIGWDSLRNSEFLARYSTFKRAATPKRSFAGLWMTRSTQRANHSTIGTRKSSSTLARAPRYSPRVRLVRSLCTCCSCLLLFPTWFG